MAAECTDNHSAPGGPVMAAECSDNHSSSMCRIIAHPMASREDLLLAPKGRSNKFSKSKNNKKISLREEVLQ